MTVFAPKYHPAPLHLALIRTASLLSQLEMFHIWHGTNVDVSVETTRHQLALHRTSRGKNFDCTDSGMNA